MNKRDFEAMLKMGYTPSEALSFLNPGEPLVEEVNSKPEPEPAPEPEAEPEAEPKPAEPDQTARIVEAINASNAPLLKEISDLRKAIQKMNLRTIGTDAAPETDRADEFIANIIKGGK